MARTKQTARMTASGPAPRRQLALACCGNKSKYQHQQQIAKGKPKLTLSTTCTDSDDEQSTSSSQSTDSDLQEANTLQCNVASNVHQGSPSRRVKVMHNDRLSQPAKRAKMRCIDKGGVETNSFCCL